MCACGGSASLAASEAACFVRVEGNVIRCLDLVREYNVVNVAKVWFVCEILLCPTIKMPCV